MLKKNKQKKQTVLYTRAWDLEVLSFAFKAEPSEIIQEFPKCSSSLIHTNIGNEQP